MKNKTKKPWAIELQKQRGRELLAITRETIRPLFAADGTCLLCETTYETAENRKKVKALFFLREIVHAAMALYGGNAEDIILANRIIRKTKLHTCDFTTMSLIEILLRFDKLVTPTVRKKLLAHIRREVKHVIRPNNAYVGYNDNFPSMACHIMVVGGELVGDKDAVQAGVDSLYSLRDLLSRRGFLTEYNSPTYAGVTLHGLSEVANTAKHPEAGKLAQQGAERMWLDLALHWHPEINWHAGPQSRAYHNNSIAWSGLTPMVMWIAFGDRILASPANTIFGKAAETCFEKRGKNLQFCQAGCGGYALTYHQIPDHIAEMVLAKRYPFRVKGTSECGTFHGGEYRRLKNGAVVHVPGRCADFGSSSSELTTYMEKEFALGTASRMYLSGNQCEFFYEIHKRTPKVKQWGDMRTIFTRYLINEAKPESPESVNLIYQQGIGFTVQDDRRALVSCSPNGAQYQKISSLKCSLILQELTGPVDEIWIGDKKLKNGNGRVNNPDWVILRDGKVMLAFYPLAATDFGRKNLITSVNEKGYRVISFYNYQGKPKNFQQSDIKRSQNGFICEVATLDDFKSVPAFLKELRKAEISDTTIMEARRIRYLREGREMMLWLDPLQQSVKAAIVNGQVVSYPPLEADSLSLKKVPWLGKGPFHNSLDWWQRIADRPAIKGLEGVSGMLVK